MQQNSQEIFWRSFDSLNGGDSWCRGQLAVLCGELGLEGVHSQLELERTSGSRKSEADMLLAGFYRLDPGALKAATTDAQHRHNELLAAFRSCEAAEQKLQATRAAWESAATALKLTIDSLQPKVDAAEDIRSRQFLPWAPIIHFSRPLGPKAFLDSPESLKKSRDQFDAKIKNFRELYDYAYWLRLDAESPNFSVFESALKRVNDAQKNFELGLARKQHLDNAFQTARDSYFASISSLQQLFFNLTVGQRVALFSLMHREIPMSEFRVGVPADLLEIT
ncbi:hypothetical protein OIN59_11995 [Acidovorax sp. D2M1]|uniref:Uncharacterized protein n=1 Tax=Acidovorax benzenivorans TaxID=2987520 RepID=A0ABT5RWT5_9BURK|nr:hypothetical protein [Acidovorax benzenivorans]MDD2178157.1 hypothetical protein [Acidovorax benzenivorans]